ncbi:cAMP phosphodiesterases class-II-domain-containing protein [Myxozyma melibiosi]|uniref:cAMP phosphodiesterases class-II-domain-containing protein n=1 Tax=Myxozyma melibiosi TaxID=54550 RepID=A0ABR1FEK2_9ASCO
MSGIQNAIRYSDPSLSPLISGFSGTNVSGPSPVSPLSSFLLSAPSPTQPKPPASSPAPLASSSPSPSFPGPNSTSAPQYLGTGLLPYPCKLTNAAYVARELVAAVCVTHAHLDHLAGFVINSSCFTADNPKVLAGLPWVVDCILKYMFNNVIWPNMTNEGDEPIGLVTLRRLDCAASSQHIRTNVEDTKAYYVKDTIISEEENEEEDEDAPPISPIDNSFEDEEHYEAIANGLEIRAFPVSHGCLHQHGGVSRAFESSAFFIRDIASGKEILMFGDVEPDSISIDPRNRPVWVAAARKFGRNKLSAIFIECSYASVQPEHSLFGHLSPTFLIQELKMFASLLKCDMPGQLIDDNTTTTTGSIHSRHGSRSFDDFTFDQEQTVSHTPTGYASPSTNVPSVHFAADNPKYLSTSNVPLSVQQQLPSSNQQSHQLSHPYSLHPHPHYHRHSKHKAMHQYSPATSRRASSVSVSSMGSGGSIQSPSSTPLLQGFSEPPPELDAPVVYLRNPPTASANASSGSNANYNSSKLQSQRRTSLLSNPPFRPGTSPEESTVSEPSPQQQQQRGSAASDSLGPLAGLIVVINHVKGLVDGDQVLAAGGGEFVNQSGSGPLYAEDIILAELETLLMEEEDLAGLRFVMARTGQSLVF